MSRSKSTRVARISLSWRRLGVRFLGADAIASLDEEDNTLAAFVLGRRIDKPLWADAVLSSEHVTEEPGHDLGRDIVDVLSAVLLDGATDVRTEAMEKEKGGAKGAPLNLVASTSPQTGLVARNRRSCDGADCREIFVPRLRASPASRRDPRLKLVVSPVCFRSSPYLQSTGFRPLPPAAITDGSRTLANTRDQSTVNSTAIKVRPRPP